ncbi:tyrosine-type recombinase/integrase [Bacillus subtilis]|uniref:tyrosine-type recombinase/integrase n=1 Tax=Bacillus subtilis TaxID=1423 RepID=UPI003F7B7C25
MDAFKEHLKLDGKSKDTIYNYTRIIVRYIKEGGDDSSPETFMRVFEEWLSTNATENASVHRAAGRAYYQFKFTKKNKTKHMRAVKKKTRNKTSWISRDQYDSLCSFIREISSGDLLIRNLALINIFVFAGLKVSEVAAIKTERASVWLDLEKNCIWCEANKIPLERSLRKLLIEWMGVRHNFLKQGNSTSLFLSRRGRPMSMRLIQHTLESYYLPEFKITPEVLRHTFAKWLLLEGEYDSDVVRTLLRVNKSDYLELPNENKTQLPESLVFYKEKGENLWLEKE